MPRREVNLVQQAADIHDAITTAMNLPGVDFAQVVMWGVGPGATAAMIAAGYNPRGFPPGILDAAWHDRELKTRAVDSSPTYVKFMRDWAEDGEGDDNAVTIRGKPGYMLFQTAKSMADAK